MSSNVREHWHGENASTKKGLTSWLIRAWVCRARVVRGEGCGLRPMREVCRREREESEDYGWGWGGGDVVVRKLI